MQTILNDHRATLSYDTHSGYVQQTLKQPLRGTAFQEILNTTLDTLADNRAVKWLSDERKALELTPDDLDFLTGEWAPRAFRAGWRYLALVVPTDAKARAALQKTVMAFHEMGVQVRTFTSPDEARDWLVNVR
jgi:hypothetical protein